MSTTRRRWLGRHGLLAAGALSLAPAAFAQKAGTDYRVLSQSAPVEAPAGKIEVVEFFWYCCPHCNAFEPLLESWSKRLPKDVVLRRVPVAFRPDFEPQQRLFFALESMDLVGKLHTKAFSAIHVERQRLTTADAIIDWVAKQGVDRAKFAEVYNSAATGTKAQQAAQLQEAYAVEGTPALGVAGKFYVPGQGPRTLVVANALIADLRKA